MYLRTIMRKRQMMNKIEYKSTIQYNTMARKRSSIGSGRHIGTTLNSTIASVESCTFHNA